MAFRRSCWSSSTARRSRTASPGGAFPVSEALSIAKQIAEGLEAAHKRGIIHSDLKPANIKLRPDGTVKILDFGLAKALDAVDASSARIGHDGRFPSSAISHAGLIFGTAAYMSPEQARGEAVDKRTDIWAFGCVLYEILAGRPAFQGDGIEDILAAVLNEEPDWSLAAARHSQLVSRRLLRTCLEKNADRRLHDIAARQDCRSRTRHGPAAIVHLRKIRPQAAGFGRRGRDRRDRRVCGVDCARERR